MRVEKTGSAVVMELWLVELQALELKLGRELELERVAVVGLGLASTVLLKLNSHSHLVERVLTQEWHLILQG